MIILILCLCIIVAITVLLIVWYSDNKKHKDFVESHSVTLQKLKKINSSYQFEEYENFNMIDNYDNENNYYNVSCKDYLIYQLQFIQKEVLRQIVKEKPNKENYDRYLVDVNSIEDFGNYDEDIGKLKLDKLVEYEKKQFQARKLRPLIMRF